MKRQFKDLATYINLHDGKGKPKIKVPPSSGLPPTCSPKDVVLVSQSLYSDILSTPNSDSINKK